MRGEAGRTQNQREPEVDRQAEGERQRPAETEPTPEEIGEGDRGTQSARQRGGSETGLGERALAGAGTESEGGDSRTGRPPHPTRDWTRSTQYRWYWY